MAGYEAAPSELKDQDWLHEHYVEKRLSGPEIASLLDTDASQVYRYLKRSGIARRPKNARVEYSETVRKSIELTIEADRQHDRHPTPMLLIARAKAVGKAQAAKERISLRAALIDLAAVCIRWADNIPFVVSEI